MKITRVRATKNRIIIMEKLIKRINKNKDKNITDNKTDTIKILITNKHKDKSKTTTTNSTDTNHKNTSQPQQII